MRIQKCNKVIFLFVTLFYLYINSIVAFSYSDVSLQKQNLENALGWISKQEWIDKLSADECTDGNNELYVLSFLQSDDNIEYSSFCDKMYQCLSESANVTPVIKQRYCLIYLAVCECPDMALCEQILEESFGRQGIMSYIYALHLLNNGVHCSSIDAMEIVEILKKMQCEDGGWSVQGKIGDVDVTAMTLQALASVTRNADSKECISDGIRFLANAQLESGGFQSYGVENLESTAQVWIALSSLGIDALSDQRFLKKRNSLMDAVSQFLTDSGLYSHLPGDTENLTATAQAYSAFSSYEGVLNGRGNLYYFHQTDEMDKENVVSQTVTTSSNEESQQMESISHTRHQGAIDLVLYFLFFPCVACGIVFLFHKRLKKISCVIAFFVVYMSFSVLYWIFIHRLSPSNDEPIGIVSITIGCNYDGQSLGEVGQEMNVIILPSAEYSIASESTVLDILRTATKDKKLQIEIQSSYVRAIDNVYEFDYGPTSGWRYYVNGECPSISAAEYYLEDGDQILWLYSVE